MPVRRQNPLVVFSIASESRAGGSSGGSLFIKVEQKNNGYHVFSGELGHVAGPCGDPVTALFEAGFEYGMDYVEIGSSLSIGHFRRVCSLIHFDNIGTLTVNGVQIEDIEIEAIISSYSSGKNGRSGMSSLASKIVGNKE